MFSEKCHDNGHCSIVLLYPSLIGVIGIVFFYTDYFSVHLFSYVGFVILKTAHDHVSGSSCMCTKLVNQVSSYIYYIGAPIRVAMGDKDPARLDRYLNSNIYIKEYHKF